MKQILKQIMILGRHYRMTTVILAQIFKDPLTLESSKKIIRDRLDRRRENFLEMVEKTIFPFPDSPYKILLDRAGYGYEDIRRHVLSSGIESTLQALYQKGVYIDILEFKGKKDVARGKDVFRFSEKDFSNPLLSEGVKTSSGGTRGAGSTMVVPLEYIKEHNPYNILASHAYGISDHPVIIWLPILPAGEGLFFNLRFTAMGNPPVKWFSQIDGRYIKPSANDRIKTKISIWSARLYGKKMPGPEFVDMRNTGRIARWMSENLGKASGFSVVTYGSSALRLIMEAQKHNYSLGNTVFWLMGEPLTGKILDEIQGYGCKAYSLFGCNELMLIGHGCANPDKPDDMHFCNDKLAVIQAETEVAHSDVTVDAFFFTTILKSSPKIFLNAQTGDYGIIGTRNCGCGFEKLGFTEHIHTVRSFEKLTAEGATFIGSDLIPLVQEKLPSQFGGDATDYQFVEEADETGIPRLYVYISPDIGEIDIDKMKALVFETLTNGVYSHTFSMSYWTQADTVQIKREHPIPTRRGKIVPLHIGKSRNRLD